MKRLKKAILLPVRNMAYRLNRLHLYYWAEAELFELRTVNVMPPFYYRWLYKLSMRLVRSKKFSRLADRAIHTIPYHVRFNVA
jgi:hypothetical protein